MTDETKKHGTDDVVDISLAADAAADAAVEAETPAEPDPLDVLRAENADLRDKYLRLAAEMDNLRRRTEREVKDAKSYSVAGFARDMLAVSDNLRRAIDAIPPEAKAAADAGRTTLIIAHRLSTISSVDRIITLKDGRVDEIGTPAELAATGGIYAELLALQASASKKDRRRLQEFDIRA